MNKRFKKCSKVLIMFLLISNIVGCGDKKEVYEISMEEAIDIAAYEADKYYQDMELLSVNSYDDDLRPSITAGDDGKREKMMRLIEVI